MPDVEALKREHPEWNIVDAVDAPGGGVWALGADGGIFALGGAPFLGSYVGESAQVRNDPTRRFTAIQRDPATGGYKLLTDRPWESYDYGAPTAPAGTPGTTPPSAAPPGEAAPGGDPDRTRVENLLGSLGLGELVTRGYDYWKSLGGSATLDDVSIWLQDQPEYETRFPGMKSLRDRGLAWSPAQYITYERQVDFAIKGAGLPAGFFDSRDDFGDFISKGWSPDEIVDTISQAATAVHTMPAETRAALGRWEGMNRPLTDGELTALWINPDVAAPIIEAKAKAAGFAGVATRTGFTGAFGGELSEAEATRLVQAGASPEAIAGVTRLAPLFAETAEETTDLGRTEALGAVAGEGPAEEAVRRRKAAREARFSGGGGAAGIGGRESGLGSAR